MLPFYCYVMWPVRKNIFLFPKLVSSIHSLFKRLLRSNIDKSSFSSLFESLGALPLLWCLIIIKRSIYLYSFIEFSSSRKRQRKMISRSSWTFDICCKVHMLFSFAKWEYNTCNRKNSQQKGIISYNGIFLIFPCQITLDLVSAINQIHL